MSSNHSRDPDAIDAWVYLYQRSILRAQGMGVLKVKIKPAGENLDHQNTSSPDEYIQIYNTQKNELGETPRL